MCTLSIGLGLGWQSVVFASDTLQYFGTDSFLPGQTRTHGITVSVFYRVPPGRGSGQVVSELAFYYDDTSLKPADIYSLLLGYVKLFEKDKN